MTDEPYYTPQQPKEADVPFFAIAILVVIGILLGAWIKSPSKRHINHQNSQSAQNSQEITPSVSKLKSSIDAVDKGEDENSGKGNVAKSDLAAQWVMADVAWMGLFIGGIGIAYIAWTLKETQSAAKSASLTLNETIKMTAIARQEQRPWIFIERKVKCDFTLHVNGLSVNWRHKIQNIGKTPAYCVCFRQIVVRTENGWVNDSDVAEVRETLIQRVNSQIGSIIIPNQNNMELGRRGSFNSAFSGISGVGDKFHLIVGVGYTDSKMSDVFYDVQVYNISERLLYGPLNYDLIHHQHQRQVN